MFNFKGIYNIYSSRETTVPTYAGVSLPIKTSILCLVSTRRGSASFMVMRVSFTESARSDFCFCRPACCNLRLIFLTKRESRNQCSGSILVALWIGIVILPPRIRIQISMLMPIQIQIRIWIGIKIMPPALSFVHVGKCDFFLIFSFTSLLCFIFLIRFKDVII